MFTRLQKKSQHRSLPASAFSFPCIDCRSHPLSLILVVVRVLEAIIPDNMLIKLYLCWL